MSDVSERGLRLHFEGTTGSIAGGNILPTVGAVVFLGALGAEALAIVGVLAGHAQEELSARGAIAALGFLSLPIIVAGAIGLRLLARPTARVAELEAAERGLRVKTVGDRREFVSWKRVRAVEFRRHEVRFASDPGDGEPRRRFVCSVHWSHAEDLIRLKNFFAERMADAGNAAWARAGGS